MSDDIVTRLRRHTTWLGVVPHTDEIAIEAADEIERLLAENERLKAAICDVIRGDWSVTGLQEIVRERELTTP